MKLWAPSIGLLEELKIEIHLSKPKLGISFQKKFRKKIDTAQTSALKGLERLKAFLPSVSLLLILD